MLWEHVAIAVSLYGQSEVKTLTARCGVTSAVITRAATSSSRSRVTLASRAPVSTPTRGMGRVWVWSADGSGKNDA